MEEKELDMGAEPSNTKVYEASVLFVPELSAEELSQTVDSLKQKILGAEGEIISEGSPLHIRLAYTVEKHINNKIRRADFAHFYWVKFAVSPDKIQSIDTYFKLDLNEKSLRHLLIKTVRENTVLTELNESKLEDIKNDELIEEVISSDVKEDIAADAITDLGGEEPLVKMEAGEDHVPEVPPVTAEESSEIKSSSEENK